MGDDRLHKRIDFLVCQGDQTIQVISDDFADVGIADVDSGAGVRKMLFRVIAGQEPVFFPLTIVNGSG